MAYQPSVDRLPGIRHEVDRVADTQDRDRAVGALVQWRRETGLVPQQLIALRHTHHAMMLAVSPAACRQVRFALRREREEGGSKRQSEDGQQRNGDQFTQYPY